MYSAGVFEWTNVGRGWRTLSHAKTDASALGVARPLLHGDVLSNQSRDFVSLLGLEPRDTLLHQIPALHVQVKGSFLGFHFPCGDHLGIGVVVQRFL